MKSLKTLSMVLAISITLVSPGCSRLENCKDLSDRFCLEKFEEDDSFFLRDKNNYEEFGSGKIEGVVVEIGWNKEDIFVYRKSTFGGDPDGWMIVNKSTGYIDGPFDRNNSSITDKLKNVALKRAAEAWDELSF
jgi:hypothetical protein